MHPSFLRPLQDMDKVYTRPLSNIVKAETRMVLVTYYSINFAQDILLTTSGNRAVLAAIKLQSELRASVERVDGYADCLDIMKMGPSTWNIGVANTFFGASIKETWTGWPGQFRVIQARDAINKYAPTITSFTDEWCDGPTTVDYPGCKSVNRNPLYFKYVTGNHWQKVIGKKWVAAGEKTTCTT
jgi:hypothetical protein